MKSRQFSIYTKVRYFTEVNPPDLDMWLWLHSDPNDFVNVVLYDLLKGQYEI